MNIYTTMDDQPLMEIAKKASLHSYSPYSTFQVGAALLTKTGDVFTGCNVENVSYGLTMCAERVAVFTAVSCGKKRGDFVKMAVAGRRYNGDWQPCSPCGACRQVINEFCGRTFHIIYGGDEGIKSVSIEDLLPDGFSEF